jgi:hypothetical protein
MSKMMGHIYKSKYIHMVARPSGSDNYTGPEQEDSGEVKCSNPFDDVSSHLILDFLRFREPELETITLNWFHWGSSLFGQ